MVAQLNKSPRQLLCLALSFGLSLCLATGAPAQTGTAGNATTTRTGPYAPEAIKHYNRGLELHQSGFLNDAIKEYQEALAKDDRLEQAYSNLGIIFTAQKSYLKATEAFDKALSLQPNRVTSLNGLASVLYARGQVEQAIEKWKKAIEINPRFASAYFNMANAFEADKKPMEARENYWRSIQLAPDMAEAYYKLGSLLNKESHPAQAEVLLARCVELSPESEWARDARKQLQLLESRFKVEEGGQRKSRAEVLKEKPPKEETEVKGKNKTTSAKLTENKKSKEEGSNQEQSGKRGFSLKPFGKKKDAQQEQKMKIFTPSASQDQDLKPQAN
jgi:tetratricopeptide (TPR) repeat protein